MWSSRQAERILLVLLLQHLDGGDGPLIFGIRDPGNAAPTAGHIPRPGAFQPVSGGQFALDLPDVAGPRALGRTIALPVLTVLAPSTRYYQQQGRQHKKLTDWAPDGHATAPLAAPPTPGAGGRQQLCRAGFAPLLPVIQQPDGTSRYVMEILVTHAVTRAVELTTAVWPLRQACLTIRDPQRLRPCSVPTRRRNPGRLGKCCPQCGTA